MAYAEEEMAWDSEVDGSETGESEVSASSTPGYKRGQQDAEPSAMTTMSLVRDAIIQDYHNTFVQGSGGAPLCMSSQMPRWGSGPEKTCAQWITSPDGPWPNGWLH